MIVTIDPPDAKDFDDAISLETDSQGNWVLGVHIADVSHFIAKGSPLDEEARLRGNSIYLPGKTIPMLPEVLSNGICSLQPGQKRFVKSAYITYDDEGNEQTIGIVTEGQSFGELGLLVGQPRHATVAAGLDVRLLRITPDTLDKLEEEKPELMMKMYKVLAQTLAEQWIRTGPWSEQYRKEK